MHTDRDRGAGAARGGDDRHEKHGDREKPGWADGLRQLYDSVVDEPLPDSFKDLLAKLDDKS
ncbi:NepR family anti-sigma factor [Pelagerythrobacter sp.]|uniref:NepR family anti-sigma factor n=1 Tax=Pelagerythrobacter sp. TaxID=2800702 RepID=UPI0035AE9935